MNTLYLFSVMAYNDLGDSKYLPDLQKAHTKEAPPPSQPASSLGGPPTTSATPLGGTSGLLLLVGVAAGITIVALNILIIGCCLHKRNQKRLKRAETANQPGKTATIEMYAPSSYNDTVTGETLSSVSEKSESYSNDGSQGDYIDEARKKAASTYLVDNTDLPPPRYQQDGTMPTLYPNNMVNARTLPHPRHNNSANIMDHRARDDQMLISKAVYIPSPSPAPPPDGSYYNMNSDRYLSYPPMDYPTQIDFTQPMSMAHLQPVSQASMISGTILTAQPMGNGGTGTLRRGILKGVSQVPQPDVTHHTTSNMGGVQLLHDLHPLNISSTSSTLTTTSSVGNGSLMSVPTSTQHKQPQSILKDPNRNKQQQQQQQHHHQQQPPTQLINTGLVMSSGLDSIQFLNIPNSAGISNNLLMTASAAYDPSNPHSLTTFNAGGATVAFTDADGHLV